MSTYERIKRGLVQVKAVGSVSMNVNWPASRIIENSSESRQVQMQKSDIKRTRSRKKQVKKGGGKEGNSEYMREHFATEMWSKYSYNSMSRRGILKFQKQKHDTPVRQRGQACSAYSLKRSLITARGSSTQSAERLLRFQP